MEQIFKFETIEQARNAAIKWLEQRAVEFGPHRKVEIGRLAANVRLFGKEVGVSGTADPFWRLRLDEDPSKGPHFNAEFGKGSAREKAAFCFQATDQQMEKLGRKRRPR
jgi:hypothetical protein